MGKENMPKPGEYPEPQPEPYKVKWQWPAVEGEMTPEKKKKFWEELFNLRPLIKGVVYRKLADIIPTAEIDLVTDRIIQHLTENIDKFDQQKNLSAWCYKVVLNAINDAGRRYKVDKLLRGMPRKSVKIEFEEAGPQARPDAVYGIADTSLNPEDQLLQKQNKEQIVEAMSGLSEGLRDTVRMYYLEGKNQEEIALALNIKPNAVKKRLFDGRAALLKLLKDKI